MQWTWNYMTEAAVQECSYKRCSENMHQIYSRTRMPNCDFNKVTKQLYWNDTSAWVFSCKFAAYFQNTFSWEHVLAFVKFFSYWKGVKITQARIFFYFPAWRYQPLYTYKRYAYKNKGLNFFKLSVKIFRNLKINLS